MNPDLNEILVFLAVAREQHFSRAADKLGLPKSTVSRKVALLEARLQMRLIERTTRKIHLTEAGHLYFEKCERAFDEIREVEKSFEQGRAHPKGILRVTCPIELAPRLASRMHQYFKKRHPDLRIDLIATNKVVDLADERVDLALRPMTAADPNMHFRILGEIKWALYASREWIQLNKAQRATKINSHPDDLESLLGHECLGFRRASRSQAHFEMLLKQDGIKAKNENPSSIYSLRLQPKITIDSLEALKTLVCEGSGICLLPEFLVAEEVEKKALVRLLPQWIERSEQLAAVYLGFRFRSAKVTAALEFLQQSSLI